MRTNALCLSYYSSIILSAIRLARSLPSDQNRLAAGKPLASETSVDTYRATLACVEIEISACLFYGMDVNHWTKLQREPQ